MKICAIVTEFNPFHNGHEYIINRAAEISGCDAVLCIMSGSFTQRGEMCVLDKHDRARHAVLGGADCVIELPTGFAVAPAEIFAKGAIKVLSQIGEVASLAFGCESGGADDFLTAANILIDESDAFKNILAEKLSAGESYIKSYSAAFAGVGGNAELLVTPNNVLGLEYTKAILRTKPNIKILPVQRIGGAFNDGKMKENFSSANAIRENISSPRVKNNVPSFVYGDLRDCTDARDRFNQAALTCLFGTPPEKLARIYGCSEGLENRLKKSAHLPFDEFINAATSKRYSSARIKRILCSNLLGIYSDETNELFNGDIPLNVLAVKKNLADKLLPILNGRDCGKFSEEHAALYGNSYNLWRFFQRLPEKRDYTVIV